jgi:hypothetical protein
MERSKRRWFIITALALCLGLVWLGRSLVLSPAPEITPANVPVSQPTAQPTADATSPSSPPAATEPARETAAPEPDPAVGGGTLQGRVIDAATRLPVKEFELRLLPYSKYMVPSDKPPITRAFKSASGRFAWKSAPVGHWTLLVVARGYQGFELRELNLASGEPTREVVLPLLRGHTLTGRVFDEDSGAAIRDASIRFREAHESWSASFRWTARQVAKSTDDGSFALEGVPAGRLTLSIGAANYAPRDMDVTVREKPSPLEIALSKGGVISGYLASADGTPVTGEVSLQNLEVGGGGFTNRGAESSEFSFEFLPAGRYRLSGHSSLGAAAKEIVLARNEHLEGVALTLSPGRTVRGVVRGLRPEQLAHTMIAVHSVEQPGVQANTQVNEQGWYALHGVAPGRARVDVFAGSRQAHKEITIPADQDLALDFDFPAGFPLHGRVSQRGKPVAGHGVFVKPVKPSQESLYARTSDQGAYEIEGLTAGEYDVFADGIAARRINVLGDTVLDLELPETELAGRVLEQGSDVPIVGVGIHLTGMESATSNVHIYKETDHFGRFALSGLEQGTILLSIYKPGFAMFRERIAYSAPITTKTVRLRRSNGVEIKAQASATGRPRKWLFVVEKLGENTRGISLRINLDENGVGSLPNALGRSTLEIYGGSSTPTVVKEWDGQSIDLKF